MEFFDSLRLSKTTDNSQRTTDFFHWWTTDNSQQTTDNFHRSKTKSCTSDAYPRTVDRCLLTVDFSCAKAHYYHAVGLTEKDDIVGACEHYLIALEIMEPLVETSPQWRLMANDKSLKTKGKGRKAHGSLLEAHSSEYERIRFVSLIYTRLGQIFYNNNYCDLSILKYKKSLELINVLQNNDSKGVVLKFIGNSYQLLNKPDSALFYYNKSLEINSNHTNRLDIEKSIAQILFDKGEKDSAYILIKNNINKIVNYGSKESYYAVLGEMYYKDFKYDSAIFYLEKSIKNQNYYTRQLSSQKLSAIYDSIGDYENKAYYDNIISDLSVKGFNTFVKNNQLQNIYNKYKERKYEKGIAVNKEKTKRIVISLTVILILSFTATLFIRYMYKCKQKEYSNSLKEKEESLLTKDIIIKQRELEIKEYNKEIEDNKQIISDKDSLVSLAIECLEMRKKEISDKDKIIRKQQKELANAYQDNKPSFNRYYESEICEIILSKKENEYVPLSTKELTLLLESANNNLGGIINTLNLKYTQLDKDDMYLICLILLHINKSGLPYLLNRSRKNIWERTKRIKTIMNIGKKEDLFLFIKNNFLK